MLLLFTKKALFSRPASVMLMLFSIILGTAAATALAGIYAEISHKMSLELRGYGANILVEPDTVDGSGFLREEDLARIKTIFWKHNIKGFAPYLYGTAMLSSGNHREQALLAGTWFGKPLEIAGEGQSVQGVSVIAPWWSVQGEYPQGPDEAIIGASLARRLRVTTGDVVTADFRGRIQRFKLSGVVTTGGYEEEQIFGVLQTVQQLLAREGRISRVLVSALTVPMDAFGRRDPRTMSKADYEKWYCTAYVTAVAKNIEEVMRGSRAKPVWQIASAEGALLSRFNLLMVLLTFMALAASATSVSACTMASMVRRNAEIGLMKAMGADRLQISLILLGEVFLVSLTGGCGGYLLGSRLAGVVSTSVFGAPLGSPAWLFSAALVSSFTVALLGSLAPLRRALMIEPVRALQP
jgi:putative ABC transport system permease protein